MTALAEFILTGFGDEIDTSLDRQMDVLSELGICHVELRGVDGRNIADYTPAEAEILHKRMRERGFRVSALGSPIGKIDITADFAPHLAKFRNLLSVARVMETRFVRIFSFFIPEGEHEKYREEVLRRMAALIECAEGTGIMLAHENEKGIYGDTADRCLDLFTSLPTAGLGFVFDPSNFVQCGEDTVRAFEMMKPYICYMHMKDSVDQRKKAERDLGFDNVSDAHRPVGQGDGNVPQILRSLVAQNFKGFLSVEPHLTYCDLVPGDGAQKFRVAVEALRALIAQAQREAAGAQA